MITEKERVLRVKELEQEIQDLEKRIDREQASIDSDAQSLQDKEDAFLAFKRAASLRITELKLLIDYYKKNPNVFVNPSERNNHEPKQKKV